MEEPQNEEEIPRSCWDQSFLRHWRKAIPYAAAALYHVYLICAIVYHAKNDLVVEWCDGLGFVIICTSIVYAYFFAWVTAKYLVPEWLKDRLNSVSEHFEKRYLSLIFVRLALYFIVLVAILVFLIVDTLDESKRLISACGIVALVLLGALFSKHPRKINWRQVLWGLSLQLIFGLIILRWEVGRSIINCLGDKVETFLAFTSAGSSFCFGYLVSRQPFIPSALPPNSTAFEVATDINAAYAVPGIVVFNSLTVIYFFSFIVNILFHFGAVQWLTVKLGSFFSWTIGTTACESLNAASNIFLGQSMAPLLIRPYLNQLTMSELHAVITSGFATIAGTVLAAYITFGVSAAHLLSASVMSAPAALAFAKLMYPETKKTVSLSKEIKISSTTEEEAGSNLLDSATRGASEAATLVLNITAIVVAFIAFMAFLNSAVSFFAGLIGYEYVTFEWLLGKCFIPLAFLMGVDWDECESVGRLIGIKTVLNEFIAYRELGVLIEAGTLSPRSIAISTYALCGFANPGSIGVQLAVLGGLCPERKADCAKVVMRAFVAGSAACFLTACIAGALITEENVGSLPPPI